MLPGIAYHASTSDDFIREQQLRYNLVELEAVCCDDCGAVYRVFVRDGKLSSRREAQLDIRDLRERAQRTVNLDCPKATPTGQPLRAAHRGKYEFLENGKIAV